MSQAYNVAVVTSIYRFYVAVVTSILYLDRPRFVSSSQASGPSSAHICRRRNVRLVYIRSGKLT